MLPGAVDARRRRCSAARDAVGRAISRTAFPGLLSSGPVTLLAGPHQAIVRPLDYVPGYLVPDGQIARPLRGARTG